MGKYKLINCNGIVITPSDITRQQGLSVLWGYSEVAEDMDNPKSADVLREIHSILACVLHGKVEEVT